LNIVLNGIGKKFNRTWLFRDVNLQFESNHAYALTGFNGSGKSTLLQIIYGYQVASAGKVEVSANGKPVADEILYKHIAIATPYMELPEELTLLEVLEFHFAFKKPANDITFEMIIAEAGLSGSEDKQVKYFSSGMKQRLKLMLAFYNDCEILLLDEPCSNLDEQGVRWYRDMMKEQKGTRTIIIASNQQSEYDFCDAVYSITAFKPVSPAK
jgi:ABC-type multidrug transport system ATPase subunit